MDNMNLQNPTVSNREIVQNIIERDVSNLYSTLRSQALSLVNNQPVIKKVAENYIAANESKWISAIQEKVDMAIEVAFINPDVSIEEAISTVNDLINTSLSQFLEEKFNIPQNTLNIALQTLFGVKL